MEGLIVILAMFVLMWVVLILPNLRARRAHNELISRLSVGDRVITTSGVLGTIRGFEDSQDAVRLEVAHGVEITLVRGAVGAIVSEDEPGPQDGPGAEPQDGPQDDDA